MFNKLYAISLIFLIHCRQIPSNMLDKFINFLVRYNVITAFVVASNGIEKRIAIRENFMVAEQK